jgi:outer membrane protein assembly factor BamB
VLPRRRSVDVLGIDEQDASVGLAAGRLAVVLDAAGAATDRATVPRRTVLIGAAFRGPRLLVAGGRRLWAVSDGRVTMESVRTPARVAAMAVDGGTVWLGGDRFTWQVDAATGAPAGPRSAVTAAPGGLAAADGLVWATDGTGLTRIDPATGRAAVRVGEPADLVALGEGALWTLTYDGDLTRRDPATGRAVAGPFPVGEEARTLVADGGAVEVGLRHPSVVRIDPADGRIVWRRDIPYT